jgi:plasmid stabilization system protein ParE
VAIEVVWAESALTTLSEAIEYIAKDSPSYAATLAVQADRAAASLQELPHRGRHVPEFGDENVREIPAGKSYRLIYKTGSRIVENHRIRSHGA